MNSKQRGLIIISFVVIIQIILLIVITKTIEIEVKSGNKTLSYEFSDGWRIVPKEKIVGLND
jgi:hypothetical protein